MEKFRNKFKQFGGPVNENKNRLKSRSSVFLATDSLYTNLQNSYQKSKNESRLLSLINQAAEKTEPE